MRKAWIIGLAAVLLLGLCACGQQEDALKKRTDSADPPALSPAGLEPVYIEGELYCSAASLEEAQQIAELYGITLVDYSQELALFSTEEDAESVIQRGKDQGWPLLTRNRKVNYF